MIEVINVHYHQHHVGVLTFDASLGGRGGQGLTSFQYTNQFTQTGIELSPLKMPLTNSQYSFSALNHDTFKGLPGLMADALPDDFGHAVFDAWMAQQGKVMSEITPLQRLQYIGARGMGALEFKPVTRTKGLNALQNIAIDSLVSVAQEVLNERQHFSVAVSSGGSEDKDAMMTLLSVGTSAGGARAKAVLAFNNDFTKVHSGQVDAPAGFTHYLMKFDGVSENNVNKETFGDPLGYSAMEYVYYLVAKDCGIEMMPCYLLDEGKRRHFLTQRFDRVGNNKLHVQTLSGLNHVDYRMPGSFSYAELIQTARLLRLPASQAEQLVRRMIFNIVARNHDDHAKNFAFMLDSNGWALAPAYDLAYSFKPGSRWVSQHWMSLNGKRDNFNRDDFYSLRSLSPVFTKKFMDRIIDEIVEKVANWRQLAQQHEVPVRLIDEIEANLRLGV